MKEENSGYLGFGIFILIIVAIIGVGTFVLKKDSFKNPKSEDNFSDAGNNNIDKIKIDKDKDLIYLTNEDIVSEKLHISYKDVVFNFKSDDTKKIKTLLDQENNTLKTSVKKTNDNNYECDLDNLDLYEAKVRDYAIYENTDYVALTVSDSNYNCETSFGIIENMASYNFRVSDGKLLEEDELYQLFNVNKNIVLEKIKEELRENQSKTTTGEDLIKIDESISNMKLNENYMVYINEDNKLEIKYIVKTSLVDYNDTIVLS